MASTMRRGASPSLVVAAAVASNIAVHSVCLHLCVAWHLAPNNTHVACLQRSGAQRAQQPASTTRGAASPSAAAAAAASAAAAAAAAASTQARQTETVRPQLAWPYGGGYGGGAIRGSDGGADWVPNPNPNPCQKLATAPSGPAAATYTDYATPQVRFRARILLFLRSPHVLTVGGSVILWLLNVCVHCSVTAWANTLCTSSMGQSVATCDETHYHAHPPFTCTRRVSATPCYLPPNLLHAAQ